MNLRGLKQEKKDDVYVVYFSNDKIDDDNEAQSIGHELRFVVERVDTGKLLLNLTGVQSISTAMTSQLHILRKKCKEKKIKLRLSNLGAKVSASLKAIKMGRYFKILDDEDKAIKSFNKILGIF